MGAARNDRDCARALRPARNHSPPAPRHCSLHGPARSKRVIFMCRRPGAFDINGFSKLHFCVYARRRQWFPHPAAGRPPPQMLRAAVDRCAYRPGRAGDNARDVIIIARADSPGFRRDRFYNMSPGGIGTASLVRRRPWILIRQDHAAVRVKSSCCNSTIFIVVYANGLVRRTVGLRRTNETSCIPAARFSNPLETVQNKSSQNRHLNSRKHLP